MYLIIPSWWTVSLKNYIYQCSLLSDTHSIFQKFILLNLTTLNLVSFSSIIIYLQSKAPKYYNLNHLIELPEMKITSSLSHYTHTQLFLHFNYNMYTKTSCSEKVNEFWYQKANSRPLYIWLLSNYKKSYPLKNYDQFVMPTTGTRQGEWQHMCTKYSWASPFSPLTLAKYYYYQK